MLCEDSAEIKRVVITDDCRNLRYVIIRALQQADSVIDSNVQDVLHRRLAGHLFEITQEPADTHITGNSIFFNVDVLMIMLLKIAPCDTHLSLNVGTDSGTFFHAAALNQHKNLRTKYFNFSDSLV